jgi:hypothetical protein
MSKLDKVSNDDMLLLVALLPFDTSVELQTLGKLFVKQIGHNIKRGRRAVPARWMNFPPAPPAYLSEIHASEFCAMLSLLPIAQSYRLLTLGRDYVQQIEDNIETFTNTRNAVVNRLRELRSERGGMRTYMATNMDDMDANQEGVSFTNCEFSTAHQ